MKKICHALFLSPLLFGIGCVVPGDDAQESTSQTDDSLSASDSLTPSAAATEGGHACNVLVTGPTNEGVHCADWAFVRQSATTFVVWGVGESLCQPVGGGHALPCPAIRQNVNIYVNNVEQAGAGHVCGGLPGSNADCPTGNEGRFMNTSGHALVTVAAGKCKTIQAGLVGDEIALPELPGVAIGGPDIFSSPHPLCN